MYPLGTSNGLQEAAAPRTRVTLMSRPIPNRGSATDSQAKRSKGAAPHLSAHPLLPHRTGQESVRAAPVPPTGGVSSSRSRHCQYLPFLFQTARVEVGHFVKED